MDKLYAVIVQYWVQYFSIFTHNEINNSSTTGIYCGSLHSALQSCRIQLVRSLQI